MHLLLPTPKFFQQFSNPVKYSCGIKGLLGTTFFAIDRISFLYIKYLGGGPMSFYLTK